MPKFSTMQKQWILNEFMKEKKAEQDSIAKVGQAQAESTGLAQRFGLGGEKGIPSQLINPSLINMITKQELYPDTTSTENQVKGALYQYLTQGGDTTQLNPALKEVARAEHLMPEKETIKKTIGIQSWHDKEYYRIKGKQDKKQKLTSAEEGFVKNYEKANSSDENLFGTSSTETVEQEIARLRKELGVK